MTFQRIFLVKIFATVMARVRFYLKPIKVIMKAFDQILYHKHHTVYPSMSSLVRIQRARQSESFIANVTFERFFS